MRVSFFLMLPLLAACDREFSNGDLALTSIAACAPAADSFVFTVSEVFTATASGVTPPSAQLQLGTTVIAATTAQLSNTTLRITPASTLAPGIYAITLKRIDGRSQTFPAALTISAVPQVILTTPVSLCSAAPAAQSVTLSGSGLSGVTATLSGGGALSVTASSDTSLTLSAPATLAVGSYDLVLGHGACTATVAHALAVGPPPTVSIMQAGPRLADDQTLAANANITVRLTGTSLTSGTNVSIGATPATSVTASADGTSATATFGANTVTSAADQAVTAANGSCVATSGSISATQPVLNVNRLNPTALASGQASVLDAFGSFGASDATPLKMFVDIDPDPITHNWQAITLLTKLDGQLASYRFHTTGVTVPTAGSYDIRVQRGTDEGFAQAKLQVTTAAAMPFVVTKSRDWVQAGENVIVWGCDLTGATFSLIDGSGNPLPAHSMLTPSTVQTDVWANQFFCGTGRMATDRVLLTTDAALAPGTYRIRAASTAGTHDDLYPLTIYSDVPILGAASILKDVNGGDFVLSVPRKQPSVVVASDETGRKYLYVMGGDSAGSATVIPSDISSVATTYEYTAVDPDHHFVGYEFGATDTTFSLGGAAPYGASVVADGTRINWMAGTTGTTTVAEILQFSVRSALASPPHFGSLASLVDTGISINTARFGATAQLIPQEPAAAASTTTAARTLIVAGGCVGGATADSRTPSTEVDVVPLQASGSVGNPSHPPATKLSTAQAFAASAQSTGQMLVVGGYKSVALSGTTSRLYATLAAKAASYTYDATPSVSRGSETATSFGWFGSASATMGKRMYLFGGASTDSSSSSTQGDVQMSASIEAGVFSAQGSTSDFADAGTTLTRKRSSAGAAVLSPYVYVVGGVVCGNDAAAESSFCADPSNELFGIEKPSSRIEALEVH